MAAVQISSLDTLSNIFLCVKNAIQEKYQVSTWCHLVQSFYIRENTAARWIAVVDRGSPNLPQHSAPKPSVPYFFRFWIRPGQ